MACPRIARATHNIMAYRLKPKPESDCIQQDHDSDGETAAGGGLSRLLQTIRAENVVVVVTRWYGGIKLGPDRFRHINHAAREALEAVGADSRRQRQPAATRDAQPPPHSAKAAKPSKANRRLK
eukprot:GHVU01013974.1.p2 GENE.GHVU01013974.1~~GHVU01013974.1.p2  ORF type:complete len:124 (-),score=26.19 GHVU01013974.1:69-440(-)